MATITLTAEDSGPVQLKTSEIARIRKMTDSERSLHSAATRLDYAYMVYVKEQPEDVAGKVAGSVPTLGQLVLPNGWPFWFDAKKAQGPLPVPPSAPAQSVNSALKIGGKLQFVRSTPQQVHDLIKAAEGNVLPVSRGQPPARSAEKGPAPEDVWDRDVPELMGSSGTS